MRPTTASRMAASATRRSTAIYFHGPAYQVLDRAWRARRRRRSGGSRTDLPPDHEPADEPDRVAAPRLIELCFQTAGVWELGTTGRMALPDPRRPGHPLRRRGRTGPAARRRPSARGRIAGGRRRGRRGRATSRAMLQGYRTIELPGALDAEALAPIRSAMGWRPVSQPLVSPARDRQPRRGRDAADPRGARAQRAARGRRSR